MELDYKSVKKKIEIEEIFSLLKDTLIKNKG